MVKTGIVGLGRLGKSHAINLLKIPNCELKSACSIVSKELEWAKDQGISEVYSDYDEMLELSDINAVFLVSSTSLHAEQIIKGLEAEKHVFCEKPLAVNVKECRKAVDIINKLAKKKFFMLGLFGVLTQHMPLQRNVLLKGQLVNHSWFVHRLQIMMILLHFKLSIQKPLEESYMI